MDKVLLFTHGVDIDGYGCAILAKLAWQQNVDLVLADNFDLDDKFSELWHENMLSNYSKIFITDHCLSKDLCRAVDNDKNLNKKIRVIDHHKTRLGLQDEFKWILVCDESQFKKQCATGLFYDYLVHCGCLRKSAAIDEFVELTRLQDTFLWENDKNGEKANRLDVFSKVAGRIKYIDILTQRLANASHFYFLPEEDKKIDEYIENLDKIIDGYISKLKIVDFEGKKAGMVEILDAHKGEITRKVRKSPLSEQIDFLFLPLLNKGSISLRNVDPACDVSAIAVKYGGGGHFAAASIPKQNVDLSQYYENN